jgi:hypothetical protein
MQYKEIRASDNSSNILSHQFNVFQLPETFVRRRENPRKDSQLNLMADLHGFVHWCGVRLTLQALTHVCLVDLFGEIGELWNGLEHII